MRQVVMQEQRWVVNGRVVGWGEVLERAAQHRGGLERVSRRQWWAQSDRDPGAWYPVVLEDGAVRCFCPAGVGGRPCKHGARVLAAAYGLLR